MHNIIIFILFPILLLCIIGFLTVKGVFKYLTDLFFEQDQLLKKRREELDETVKNVKDEITKIDNKKQKLKNSLKNRKN